MKMKRQKRGHKGRTNPNRNIKRLAKVLNEQQIKHVEKKRIDSPYK